MITWMKNFSFFGIESRRAKLGLWVRVVDGKSIWYNDSLISETEYLRSFWVNIFFNLFCLEMMCDCANQNYKRWRTEQVEAFFLPPYKTTFPMTKAGPRWHSFLSAPQFLYHSSYYSNTRMAQQYALQNTFQFWG